MQVSSRTSVRPGRPPPIRRGTPASASCTFRQGIVVSKDGGALEPMLSSVQARCRRPRRKRHAVVELGRARRPDRRVRASCSRATSPGAVNATAPNPVTNEQFTKALGKALHRPTVLPVSGLRHPHALRRDGRGDAPRRPAGASRATPRRGLRVLRADDRRRARKHLLPALTETRPECGAQALSLW